MDWAAIAAACATAIAAVGGIWGTARQARRGREAASEDLRKNLEATAENLRLTIDAENARVRRMEKRQIYANCIASFHAMTTAAVTAAVRAMPELVPTTPDDPASEANRAAWRRLAAWDKPFLVAFSDRDPITGSMAPVLKDTVPGAAGLEHPVIEGAGHFLQEDAGERLAAVIAGFVRAHPA